MFQNPAPVHWQLITRGLVYPQVVQDFFKSCQVHPEHTSGHTFHSFNVYECTMDTYIPKNLTWIPTIMFFLYFAKPQFNV